MTQPVAELSVVARRSSHQRMWLIVGCSGPLAAVFVFLFVMGWLAPKVILGRHWPQSQWLPLDQIPHDAWDALLRRHVDELGRIDYSAWRASTTDLAALDEYLALLSRGDPNRDVPRTARLAFWINAYNALTVRGILREYPTSSIQNHMSRWGGYDIWRHLLLTVGDDDYSLGRIEHQLLRPLHEPRIHFAIVCGSRGCPRLRNGAYASSDLERQLDDKARDFFADPQKLEFNRATGELRLSPIMKWYADDFGSDQSAMLKTITPYLHEDVARQLNDRANVRIEYADYDWSLNGKDDGGAADAPVPPDSP